MPTNYPPLALLINQVQGAIQSRLPGSNPMLPVSLLGVLATVQGGSLQGQYGNLAYRAKQLMPDTADLDHLIRWASIWGLAQKLANQAQFQVTATGTPSTPIPPGTLLNRNDGATFTTNTDIDIGPNNAATLTVTAVTAGSAGNTPAGSQLTFSTGIPGVLTTVTVGAQIVAGNDDETPAALLQRLLFRLQNPPQGGCPTDYVIWATDQPGVTRAWVYPLWQGPGTVGVSFVMDARANIFPLPADVAAVQAALNILAPVTATVIVFAPTQQPINPVIHLNIANTPAIQAAVITELGDFVTQAAQPGAVAGQPTQGTIYLSQLDDAIGNSPGVVDYTLLSPAATLVMPPGVMATLGNVTFQ
jgi:uncharacterized phage protein gp47/JayE